MVTLDVENKLIKLRRRLEEYLRSTTPQMLIEVADVCNIKVPDSVRKSYPSKDSVKTKSYIGE
jgi:HKD family nuclease